LAQACYYDLLQLALEICKRDMNTVLLCATVGAAAGLRMLPRGERGEHSPPRGMAAPLAVPFYMYEPPSWNSACSPYGLHHQNCYPDFAFHRQLEDHPWRVQDRAEAKLFVVPAYVSGSLEGHCGDHAENMRELARMMENSSSFRASQGRDHMISAFTWKAKPERLGDFEKYLRGMIVAHFERAGWPRTIVVPYGSIGAGREQIETLPHAERQRKLFFIGRADCRPAYYTRRLALQKLPHAYEQSVLMALDEGLCQGTTRHDFPPCAVPGRVSGCLTNRSFDTYASLGGRSNYSLVIHGDSPSTSRLYDGFEFDQVPVIISDGWRETAMPFADALPWDSMAVFIKQLDFESYPVRSMGDAIASASDPSRLAVWQRVRPALDWSLDGTCVATATLLDAARRYLRLEGLPELLALPCCDGRPGFVRKKRLVKPKGALNETLLKAMLMESRLN